MTNGEKIQSMFPNINFGTLAQDDMVVNRDYSNNDEPQVFIPVEVWNSEYKEPTPKNDSEVDAISRADAIQAMQDKAKKLTNEDIINGLCGAVAILYEMPSVTPQEPKTGHWVLTDVEGYRVWHCHCSECGKDPQNYIGGSEDWWLIKSNLPKFCPSCGSRNEVEE